MHYAKFFPRGFSNEFDILAFATQGLRDQFIAAVPRTTWSSYYGAWVQHDNGSAWAESVSAREVEKITRGERRNERDMRGNFVRSCWRQPGGYNTYRCVPLTLPEYFGSAVIEKLDERGFDISEVTE